MKILILTLALLGLCEQARAVDISEWQESSMKSAVRLSGLEHDGSYPSIVVTSDKAISELTGCTENCGEPQAYYDAITRTIYFGSSIDTTPEIFARALMVHEYVHYLQYGGKQEVEYCQAVVWERDAREVQIKFLQETGLQVPMHVNMPWGAECHKELNARLK